MDNIGQKLLRYLVDTDGSIDPKYAREIADGGIITSAFFEEYDPKQNVFLNTPYSEMFDTLIDYVRTCGCPMTDSILEECVQEQTELQPKHKHAYIEAIRQLRRERVRNSEFQHHRNALVSEYQRTQAIYLMMDGINRIKEDPVAAMHTTTKALADLITRTDVTSRPADTSMDLASFARWKAQSMREGKRIIEPVGVYGLPSIDRTIGGLFPGEMTIIAGGYSTGKSFALQKIVLSNAAAGVPTVWASRENSDHQTWARLLAYQTGIPSMKITTDNLTEEERVLIQAAADELAEMKETNLLIVPPKRCVNALMLKNEIQAWGKMTNGGVVGVDYLNKMESYRYKGSEKWMQIAAITDELKNYIGHEFGASVCSPTQLNRAGAKDPGKGGISEIQFNSINQDADNVFMMWSDPDHEYKRPEPGDYYGTPGEVFLELQRARNAPKNLIFKAMVDFTISMFEETDYIPKLPEEVSKAKKALMGDSTHAELEEYVQPEVDD